MSSAARQLVAVQVLYLLGAEVDAPVEELLDQVTEDVGLDQREDLVAKLELVEDHLNVGRKAVQIGFEIGLELLLLGPVLQVAQGKGRNVVKVFARGLTEGGVLVGDPGQKSL